MATLPLAKLLPWGRLVLQQAAHTKSLPKHYDLVRSKHCVGRVANRCDIHIDKKFISGLHCIIRLQGKDSKGEPIVEVEDVSRYGVWVNSKKVGTRRKALVEKGDLIHFATPGSKVVLPLCYRLDILPSGLTKKNEELHARLSADEMSVAGRTRKRTHEETKCTQSPSRLVQSPPQPRPVKRLRRVTKSQQSSEEHESEPVSEPISDQPSTPSTQRTAGSQEPPSGATGKRRRRADVPAPDSRLAKLEEETETMHGIMTDALTEHLKISKKLTKAEEELASLRKENEVLKKSREEEQAARRKEVEGLKKAHEEELKKTVDQAKNNLDELSRERDFLKRTVDDITTGAPKQVRTVFELEAKIEELRRILKNQQAELAVQHQAIRSETTPPSKKQLVEIERKNGLARQIAAKEQENLETITRNFQSGKQNAQERLKLVASFLTDQTISSGSSQSQDSLRGNHNSLLSIESNEHSEPSPGDMPLTLDEETKSGDTSQGLPPLFNVYGASTSASGNARAATLSESQAYRSTTRIRVEDQESKGQQDATVDEETKGRENAAEDEETKGDN